MTLDRIIVDWIHLLAAATWIGGLVFINFVFYPAMEKVSPADKSKVLGVMGQNFAKLATVAMVALVVTGLFNLPAGFDWGSVNKSGTYFTVLILKLLIFASMGAIGGYMGQNLGPKLQEIAPQPGDKPSPEFLQKSALMRRLGWVNMYLGIVLLFFAGALLNAATFDLP